MISDPVLIVLFYGVLAASASALGALPFAFGEGPRAWVVGAAFLTWIRVG